MLAWSRASPSRPGVGREALGAHARGPVQGVHLDARVVGHGGEAAAAVEPEALERAFSSKVS